MGDTLGSRYCTRSECKRRVRSVSHSTCSQLCTDLIAVARSITACARTPYGRDLRHDAAVLLSLWRKASATPRGERFTSGQRNKLIELRNVYVSRNT